MTNSRNVIVLLGMHRSGTSLAMSMLSSLGVACGEELIPAARSNEAGFWEHAGIVAAHERLLSRMRRVWHGPMGTHPFPNGWMESESALAAKIELAEIVHTELDKTENIWGFKDPRTARFLPLWETIFARLDVRPTYILSVRHPAAVTASLQKHNGMDPARGELVWLLHNLDAIRHAGERLKLVVDYDRIVADPVAQARRLASALPESMGIGEEAIKAAAARVSTTMRRNESADSEVRNPLVAEVHAGLQHGASDSQQGTELAWMADNIEALQDLFNPWITDTKSPVVDWAIRALLRGKYR